MNKKLSYAIAGAMLIAFGLLAVNSLHDIGRVERAEDWLREADSALTSCQVNMNRPGHMGCYSYTQRLEEYEGMVSDAKSELALSVVLMLSAGGIAGFLIYRARSKGPKTAAA